VQVQLLQSSDVLNLTGMTRHQLREWSGKKRRNILPPDVEPRGPGRHALYSWRTILALRILRLLHEEFAIEVGAWSEAIRVFRAELEVATFTELWGSSVAFLNTRQAKLVESGLSLEYDHLTIPLRSHLEEISRQLAMPPPTQLALFPAMAVAQ
jgi:hypothetical protein